MATIKIKNLEPGVTLSADVKDANGRMLLNAGSVVTEKHIQIFKTWGVTEVTIAGDAAEEDEISIQLSDISPELMQIIMEKINLKFHHCDQKHPVFVELINHIKIKLAKELLALEKA